MQVRDAMTPPAVMVGTACSLREAAQRMTAARTGSAVVADDDLPGYGIVTERDLLQAVAQGRDLDAVTVRDCMTFDARTAAESWDLDRAAEEMVGSGFRHLLVVDDRGALVGIVSMRDIVRVQVEGRAVSP